LKIIYLHQYFNTPEMSGGTRSYEIARRMVESGHEVYMITSDRRVQCKKTEKWRFSLEAGINVYWTPVAYSNEMKHLERVAAFIKFLIVAFQKAKELDCDIIYATSTPLTIGIPSVFLSKIKKIPMVFEVRDLWPEVPIAMKAVKNNFLIFLLRKLEKWIYKNSSAIVALSPGMKEGVVRAGYPHNQVAVIPNGSDMEDFSFDQNVRDRVRSSMPWLNNDPLILYTGTLGKVNGVDYLVHLARELLAIKSNIKIFVVGTGSEARRIERIAKSCGVFEVNFFLKQRVSKREVADLYCAAEVGSNIVIDVPELRANSANKFFDTLAAGKPVLINHGGWMQEIVETYDCGVSAWRRTAKEVALLLDSRLNDPRWLDEVGGNAHKVAKMFFDRGKLAGEVIAVIEAVADNQSYRVAKISPGSYHINNKKCYRN